MAHSRFCRECREFHDLAEPWPVECYGHFGVKGDDAGFYVQSDTVDPFRSMADGKTYDSKSRYRAELKARGMVEIGNDNITPRRTELPPVRDTLRQTMAQLQSR